ncbi:hypothetical protein [Mobilicoccus pelagius]|uniref:Uncharacterized protein n=1 Tax=Mobilicoccus pelagius NBRC 104925 TaxID=1089455 RepID=H5UVQ6_9MICO|nr:hypothetical protein [Mobilicoccus pelagius]GAB49814.1 hypothetical protein MOPEL_135_00520 [Mobilicoccus pelagius NBRC 104925]
MSEHVADPRTYMIPPHLERLCDDTALFPPGDLTLEAALAAHIDGSWASHRAFLGPLIAPADRLDELAALTADLPRDALWFALTAPSPDVLGDALRQALTIPAVWLAGAEVALTDDVTPRHLPRLLATALDEAGVGTTEIYVEVPRDERRPDVLDALADSDFDAKFRTGGVHAELHPGEEELADAILGAVTRHLPFKATGGLHRAIRHTDPATGFERHGFCNLFLAVDAARQGVDTDRGGLREHLVEILADRDGAEVGRRIRALEASRAMVVRASFTSFGSSDVKAPLADLVALGLVDAPTP